MASDFGMAAAAFPFEGLANMFDSIEQGNRQELVDRAAGLEVQAAEEELAYTRLNRMREEQRINEAIKSTEMDLAYRASALSDRPASTDLIGKAFDIQGILQGFSPSLQDEEWKGQALAGVSARSAYVRGTLQQLRKQMTMPVVLRPFDSKMNPIPSKLDDGSDNPAAESVTMTLEQAIAQASVNDRVANSLIANTPDSMRESRARQIGRVWDAKAGRLLGSVESKKRMAQEERFTTAQFGGTFEEFRFYEDLKASGLVQQAAMVVSNNRAVMNEMLSARQAGINMDTQSAQALVAMQSQVYAKNKAMIDASEQRIMQQAHLMAGGDPNLVGPAAKYLRETLAAEATAEAILNGDEAATKLAAVRAHKSAAVARQSVFSDEGEALPLLTFGNGKPALPQNISHWRPQLKLIKDQLSEKINSFSARIASGELDSGEAANLQEQVLEMKAANGYIDSKLSAWGSTWNPLDAGDLFRSVNSMTSFVAGLTPLRKLIVESRPEIRQKIDEIENGGRYSGSDAYKNVYGVLGLFDETRALSETASGTLQQAVESTNRARGHLASLADIRALRSEISEGFDAYRAAAEQLSVLDDKERASVLKALVTATGREREANAEGAWDYAGVQRRGLDSANVANINSAGRLAVANSNNAARMTIAREREGGENARTLMRESGALERALIGETGASDRVRMQQLGGMLRTGMEVSGALDRTRMRIDAANPFAAMMAQQEGATPESSNALSLAAQALEAFRASYEAPESVFNRAQLLGTGNTATYTEVMNALRAADISASDAMKAQIAVMIQEDSSLSASQILDTLFSQE